MTGFVLQGHIYDYQNDQFIVFLIECLLNKNKLTYTCKVSYSQYVVDPSK